MKKGVLKDNLKLRLWLGIVSGIIAIIINCCVDYYSGPDKLELIKVLAMMLFSLIALMMLIPFYLSTIAICFAKTFLEGKKGYSDSSETEALLYFENNPCEMTYIDSMGRTWDNVYFDK